MSPAPERTWIEGPAGALEAIVEDPGNPGSSYAVVCHPHPLFGGTMDNKVVTTVARALHETGIPTVRFNFRGVGASAGAFDDGVGETADADAVASWGGARWPGREAPPGASCAVREFLASRRQSSIRSFAILTRPLIRGGLAWLSAAGMHFPGR